MSATDVLLIGSEELENLGLRYLLAYLLAHGRTAAVLRCDGTSQDELVRAVLHDEPRIVGFSMIFQRMFPAFAQLIGRLRDAGVTAHVTMGGHFPTVAPRYVLEHVDGLDSIVRCEGEETLLELLEHIDEPDTWPQIPGLAVRRNGEIVVSPARPLLRDLDELPFPRRREPLVTHRGLGVCTLIASRGCYYDCSFCSIRTFYHDAPGPKRRTRSPQNVVREMRDLYDRCGARLFIFEDDDIGMRGRPHRQWIERFVDELRASGISRNILWRVSCRVDEIDAELLPLMRDVGLVAVYTGIEAGDTGGLITYNKRYTVDRIHQAVGILRAAGMPFEFGFMLLNPDSTLESVREDIEFLRWIGAAGDSVVHFTKMLPYTGTPIANRLEREGRLAGGVEAPDYTFLDPRLDLLQQFCTMAFHDRNFDPRGVVESLRHAKFDCAVVRKFCSDRHDAAAYASALQSLVRRANSACVETLSLAMRMIERLTPDQILDRWSFLERLAAAQLASDREYLAELDDLMSRVRGDA